MAKHEQYRSHSEQLVADWLDRNEIRWEYEKYKFEYTSRIKGGVCEVCGERAVQRRVYTPDFYIPSHKFFIEVKGRLTSHDRKKMRDFKRANPDVDVRLLLLANNKLEKNKDERYSDWCTKFGFTYALRSVNQDWFKQ